MAERFDPENMFKSIWDFSENLEDALKIGVDITLNNSYENVQNIIIAGMGGSAIGGDIMSILEKENIDIPLFVCREY
ncbi:MAG: bifunctional phosphoglucose/phosphomannose isomerase, partial [Candidatus Marinimicrobia bacterium]|nr:bifunctional phosphoglucose/phosphomannose isomerase [Candidatus Neomarinimicrobiota bacterium]